MRVLLSPAAQRDLRKLSHDVQARVLAAADGLMADPRPPGCLKLHDYTPPTWRLRVGDWRVLYEIDDAAGIVTVTTVRHRNKAYRGRTSTA